VRDRPSLVRPAVRLPAQGPAGSTLEASGGADSLAPSAPLRCISYLAPSLPDELFRVLAEYLAAALGTTASIEYETRFSAPESQPSNGFALNRYDLGFVCSTALALAAEHPAGFELVPYAPVFDDTRAEGRPVYFSEVTVRGDSQVFAPEDLAGGVWAYNDSCSLSGYFSLLEFLDRRDLDLSFLGGMRHSGSHLGSIELVMSGQADAAAIDSNVLSLQRRRRPELRTSLRVIASWGPFPVQPVVVRTMLPGLTKLAVAEALSQLASSPETRRRLEPFGLQGFAEVDEAFYATQRQSIERCRRVFGQLPG